MSAAQHERSRVVLWLVAVILCLLGLTFLWHQTRPGPATAADFTPTARPAAGSPPTTPSPRAGSPGLQHESAIKPPAVHRRTTQRVLEYGSGEGDVGLIRVPEMAPIGPESFALARNGNVLVADTANHRIQVYARDGTFLRSVELPGVSLNDVMSDAHDRLYVYDQDRQALLQFDASGNAQATLKLKPADIDTRGYFHIAGDAIWFANAGTRDVLVAVIKDGTLAAPGADAVQKSDGIHAESGRVYSVSVARGESLRLEFRDGATPAASQAVALAAPDILSACFVGEDQSGRFLLQTERLVGGRVTLEVLTFSPAGEQLSAMRLPENDYAVWTAKLLDVAADGTIVQFLLQKERAKLNWFSEQPQ